MLERNPLEKGEKRGVNGGEEGLGAHQPLQVLALGLGWWTMPGTGCSFIIGIAGAAQP